MPTNWTNLTIDEIKAPVPHSITMGPFGSDIKTENFVASGVPVIRGVNLSSGRFNKNGFVFVTDEKADELYSANAFPEDIVFTHRGTLGQVGIIPINALHKRYIVSQSQMKLTCDPQKAYPLFVFYYFRSSFGQHALLANTSTTGVPAISRPLTSLKSTQIPIPPLFEQKAIAHILGTLDDKIELNHQMNQKLEAIAQAIFKSWFVDFDPVRAKMEGRQPVGMDDATATLFPDSFEDSLQREIPKGWKLVPFSEVVEVNPRRSLCKEEIAPYLDMQNMPIQGHKPDTWINRPFGSGTKFINGDTLLARITPCLENGKTAFVDFLEDGQVGWGSTEYIIFRPNPPLPLEYGYYLARSEELQAYAIQNMTGSSGRQRVPAECFHQYLIVIPQDAIAQCFGDLTKKLMATIKANSEQSKTLASIRDTLLPKLMSGEIRVKEAEKILEDAA